ncbi:ABC transporter ATP-binding protein [Parvibium lacunae]|uniref:ABC transporter ATP-binding protein n=1 Tax=Parvibium lacunae TaxID=1888893 RepID=A0A368KYU4_9BURK|nr:ABC transporter ATP-binding protein [Parvibium lacunae]RCS56573.1 ABC transporter ATP-binding protein [Parvibium lacunae]
MMPLLEIDNLSLTVPLSPWARWRGQSPFMILNGINLAVMPGTSTAIVGLNGAGKTSLLRCILNFVTHYQGHIRLAGISARQPKARQQLAFLPERHLTPTYLTGLDFLKTQLGLYGVSWDRQLQSRCHAQAAQMGLAPACLGQAQRHYSKGMQQKLALLALRLAQRPIWLLDEPMSGLDPLARAELRSVLQAQRAAGTSLLFTTHHLHELDQLADSLIVLHGGQLRYAGSLAALRSQAQLDPAAPLEPLFLSMIETPPTQAASPATVPAASI